MKIAEYILSSNIRAAIYQALIENKDETDFSRIDSLAIAIALDSMKFLEDAGLIEIKDKK